MEPGHFLRPKGANRTAQGFSPGNGIIRKIALKVAAGAGLVRTKFNDGMMKNKREVVSPRPPFQGGFIGDAFPGLKPWAVLCSPFGRGTAGDR
jgi:hypothetical protein